MGDDVSGGSGRRVSGLIRLLRGLHAEACWAAWATAWVVIVSAGWAVSLAIPQRQRQRHSKEEGQRAGVLPERHRDGMREPDVQTVHGCQEQR